jgi:hypothetical protein
MKHSSELNRVLVSDEKRTGHFPSLVGGLARRLDKSGAATKDGDAVFPDAAVAHGPLRYQQGDTSREGWCVNHKYSN